MVVGGTGGGVEVREEEGRPERVEWDEGEREQGVVPSTQQSLSESHPTQDEFLSDSVEQDEGETDEILSGGACGVLSASSLEQSLRAKNKGEQVGLSSLFEPSGPRSSELRMSFEPGGTGRPLCPRLDLLLTRPRTDVDGARQLPCASGRALCSFSGLPACSCLARGVAGGREAFRFASSPSL